MKYERLSLNLLLLAFMLIVAAIALVQSSGEANGERIGSQSSPPGDGDWIINTTGNVIIDETFMVEMRAAMGSPPSFTIHDDSVQVHGNLTIEPGGELKLINASLTFDDQDGDGFYVEVGGNLTMNASGESWNHREGETTVISTESNNSALRVKTGSGENHDTPASPLLTYVYITGKVIMGDSGCAINYVDSDDGFIKVENGEFNGTMLPSAPLIIIGSYANITESSFISESEDEALRQVYIKDSTVGRFANSSTTSNGSIGMWIEDSEITIQECNFLTPYIPSGFQNFLSKGIYAEDSQVSITGGGMRELQDYAIKTRGDTELVLNGTVFRRLNADAEPDGRYALDLAGSSTIIENSEFKSKNRGPLIGGSGDGFFRLYNIDFHNMTGDPVVYDGGGRVELEENLFYDIKGTTITVRNAAEVVVKNNEFTYSRKWDSKVGDYVVRNIMGKGLVVESVENFTIEDNLFLKTGSTAIEIIGSSEGVIEGNNFSQIGHDAVEKLHTLFLDRSFANITGNILNGGNFLNGYGVFVVGYGGAGEDLVLDGAKIIADNQFNQSLNNKFAQTWELNVRTMDPGGNPVKQVTINLSTGEEFEEFHTDNNGSLGPVYIYNHIITGENNLTTYDIYGIYANITKNNISFSASAQAVPDRHRLIDMMINPLRLNKQLSVVDPASGDVLNEFTATLSFHVFNDGTGTIHQNFTLFYRPSGEEDWMIIEEVRLPIFKGDRDYDYVWSDVLAIGSYDIMVSLTGNVSVEISEAQTVKLGALEVFSRPTISFDQEEDAMISGKHFTITGKAVDPMEDKIVRVEMFIQQGGVNGTKLFPEISKKTGYWEWGYTLDTTTYLNNPYKIWVMAVNEGANWSFARSSWESTTLIINNEPSLVITGTNPDITQPGQEVVSKIFGYTILVQGNIVDLYNNTHIMERIDVSIDGQEPRPATMKLNVFPTTSTWAFTWEDFLDFSDGPHQLEITGYYNNSKETVAMVPVSITITIDSDRPETDPVLIINSEKPMTEEGNYIISGTASDDWQLTLLQYKLGSGGQWTDIMTLPEETTETDWSVLLDYRMLVVGPNYIYVKASDGFTPNENFTIILFAYRYDLEVLELTVPTEGTVRQNFTVTTKVLNRGPHDTPANVLLHCYIGSIPKEKFISVKAGETKTFDFSFNMAEGGVYPGKVIVNPGMMAEEENSTNNELVSETTITLIDPSSGGEGGDDDEGIFEGNTLLILVGFLVILFVITAVVYYSFSSRPLPGPQKPYQKIEEAPLRDLSGGAFMYEHTVGLDKLEELTPEDEQKEKKEEGPSFPPRSEKTPEKPPGPPSLTEKKEEGPSFPPLLEKTPEKPPGPPSLTEKKEGEELK